MTRPSAREIRGGESELEKVEDLREIMKYRVMSTPALVIEGAVKSAGRALPAADVLALLQAQAKA